MKIINEVARYVPYKQPGDIPEKGLHVSSFIFVRKQDSILLVKKLRPDWQKSKWAVPSSLLKYGEHPDDAANRVLKEQLGAVSKDMEMIEIQSHVDHHWDICFIYGTSTTTKIELGEDVSELRFFHLGKLPRKEMSPTHMDVIDVLKTRGKIP